MYKIKVINQFKAIFTDIFTNRKEPRTFLSGQVIEGRVDNIAGKTYLVLEDGFGADVDSNFLEKIS